MRYPPMSCTPVRCTFMRYTPMRYMPMRYIPMRQTPMRCTPMRYTPMKCRLEVHFHSQNAGFEMSAPIGIGVKISAGGGVSFSPASQRG
jgi:hypothetical protein